MDNIFDALQQSTFNVISLTMGYDATWIDENKIILHGRVLYKDATEKQDLSGVNYIDEKYQMEYTAGDFPGLKSRVDNGLNEIIIITVRGTDLQFYVRRIESKYDGKTFIAILQPVL